MTEDKIALFGLCLTTWQSDYLVEQETRKYSILPLTYGKRTLIMATERIIPRRNRLCIIFLIMPPLNSLRLRQHGTLQCAQEQRGRVLPSAD